MMSVQTGTAAHATELSELKEEWSALWDRCPDVTPFSAPEWLLPWWEHLFGGGEQWTIAVRSDQRLVGLAPLFFHGRHSEPRQVSAIGSGVTDYLGFLLEQDAACESVQKIWEYLGAAPRWDICDLQEIPEGSPILQSPFPRTWRVERLVSDVCPVVQLPGTRDEFEARLSPKFRHNLRNSRNRIVNLAGAGFEIAAPQQDGEYIEALFRLHSDRWGRRNEKGMLASGAMQSFFRDVVAGFRRRGLLRFYGLRYRGRLAAVMCVFIARARAFYYLGGFDESLERYGPGTVLLGYAIENAIDEGLEEFDFLRKPEPYKYRWGAVDRLNARLVITRTT